MIFGRRSMLFGLFLGVALVGSGTSLPAQNQPAVNTIKSIKTVQAGVEIEVTSTNEFPVRDELVALTIGNKEFSRSRPPEDGTLNTLIFILTAEEFDRVATGDKVAVRYGRAGSGERRSFGKLDKKLRDKK